MVQSQNPVNEVHLSQARNKALEKLGIGLNNGDSEAQKPWESVFKPWFRDPQKEADYRDAAFQLHRRFLVRLLVQGGIAYLAIATMWLLFVLLAYRPFVGADGMQTVRVAAGIVRFSFCAACLASAWVISKFDIKPRAAALLVMSLTYLVAAVPLVDMARDVDDSQAEAVELVIVYLVAYRVLVPIFQVRYVFCAMWLLTIIQLVYMISLYSDNLQVRTMLILRETVKGVALNVLGTSMGIAAERHRRRNFLGATLYHDEVVLMSSVRSDVQRLLLNTLPISIVREVASGQVEVAHRYEQEEKKRTQRQKK